MPFALTHKPSKKQLRRGAPTPLDLSLDRQSSPCSNLPTPPHSADSPGFKMFWKKKSISSSTSSPLPYYPAEPPRPILKTTSSTSSTSSIRFAGSNSIPPQVIITPEPIATQAAHSPSPTRRRSSRPTSPAATSFSARMKSNHSIIAEHITTPPTAYVSTFQERQPPPPSPYRPTTERHRASTSFARPLPELASMGDQCAVRPPRHSSLFASESMATIPDRSVPMLNIIPATPQETYEEFTGAWVPAPRRSALEESIKIDELEEIPLDNELPSIDVTLDFSPFQPMVDLPLEEEEQEDLPPSPPFDSFPSLPSLSSMPSSESESSMTRSTSTSSIVSFPDVEEALGSMLASLSDNNINSKDESTNPGLGLGLDLPDTTSLSMSTPTTAPLSPIRRRPPPLDLSRANQAPKPENQTAPPCINHRVAFYRTARAAPNSPTSGIFTVDMSHTSTSSLDLASWNDVPGVSYGVRDSISLASESSDDDLHTASIISLTPVLGDRPRIMEVMLPVEGEVGLAL